MVWCDEPSPVQQATACLEPAFAANRTASPPSTHTHTLPTSPASLLQPQAVFVFSEFLLSLSGSGKAAVSAKRRGRGWFPKAGRDIRQDLPSSPRGPRTPFTWSRLPGAEEPAALLNPLLGIPQRVDRGRLLSPTGSATPLLCKRPRLCGKVLQRRISSSTKAPFQ
ncbi:hypothetical protein E2320_014316 [Naja naja]|nr:hypothetical protein E2320_014316 [Naja naja]